MSVFVVYDTLVGSDANRRKIRVDKHGLLEEAKRSAQLRFIRLARPPQSGDPANLERITVETVEGEIVYELPEAATA